MAEKMVQPENLSKGQLQMLRRAFEAFEIEAEHKIPTSEIPTILEMLGKPQGGSAMAFIIDEFDPWNTGKLDFDTFKELACRYLTEEENPEAMAQELREAFRLYDKEVLISWRTTISWKKAKVALLTRYNNGKTRQAYEPAPL